ncbi:MAG: hypothetical protein AB2A00_20610 [Myxococcota bacterium]
MQLPPALAPWTAQLSLFPDVTAVALGRMAQRLALAVGPLNAHDGSGTGEPDGVDGLSQRGSYERLLMSEWLLAQEAPDEFVRRAAVGEHVFLRLARRRPAVARATVALFDAGPEQLGTPRVAQLAALIVLSRRAEAAGATFRWGILQQRETVLQEGLTPANVTDLLHARTSSRGTETHLDAWRSRLRALGGVEEMWLVGGEPLARLVEGTRIRHLEIRDVLDPVARALAVSLRDARTPREVELELPDDETCAQLLRDPFVQRVPAAVSAPSVSSNLVFAHNRTRLFARVESSSVVGFRTVPTSGSEGGAPVTYRLPDHGVVMGAGWWRKTVLLVSHGVEGFDHVFHLHEFSPRGRLRGVRTFRMDAVQHPVAMVSGHIPLQPVHVLPWSQHGGERFYVLDPARRLIRLEGDSATVVDPQIVAYARYPSGLVYAQDLVRGEGEDAHPTRLVLLGAGQVGDAETRVDNQGPGCFFGFAGRLEMSRFGLVALEWTDRRWAGVGGPARETVVIPRGMQAVGVVRNPKAPREMAIVALEDDRRTIYLFGRTTSTRLPPAIGEIEHVALSTAAAELAYSTVNGDVVIYGLDTDELLMLSRAEVAR